MTSKLDTAGLVERLRAACVGHPHAKIEWPHRLLHEAADALATAEARAAEMEARLATICKVQSDNYGDATATHVALIKPCDEARAALAHKGEGR